MTFDHFQQDQTVVIRYDDEHGRETAGFQIVDRPQAFIRPAIELHDRASKASTEKNRNAILAEKDQTLQNIASGRERAFLGKVPDGSALLRLADANGRPIAAPSELKVVRDSSPFNFCADGIGGIASSTASPNRSSVHSSGASGAA
jgi:hypothetical protein